jgi:DNA-directed RNA polymerase beta subunit
MEKFHFLVFALQKLFSGVQGKCAPESPDHVMLQEVLMGGHLYLQLIKDKLANWLITLQYTILRKLKLDTSMDTLKPSRALYVFKAESIYLIFTLFDPMHLHIH